MKLSRSRLSGRQRARLLEHFVAGTPARSAAQLVGVNRNTSRLFYHRLRELIARRLGEASPPGGARAAAGPPSAARAPSFAVFKRDGKVFTAPLPVRGQPDALIHDDAPQARASVSAAQLRLSRADPRSRAPVDSIDNFWSQAQRHLRKYNGIPRRHLELFLKECEWRFNYGPTAQLLDTLARWIGAAARR